MPKATTHAFHLPQNLAAKADEVMIGRDEQHFTAIANSLEEQIATLTNRLRELRTQATREGQAAMDRDLEIHRITADLRALRRYGIDLCLGRMVRADDPNPVYIGRTGLTDRTGNQLLIDWRTPAAEPFFAATHADPMGLVSRRRFRWTLGKVSDYWDEVFTAEGLHSNAALDDQSAFIESLGSSRSAQMRDVLSTIQSDQDAIMRASSRGALVVDGGPGTGKTVVALHRAAYLLYADPRLGHNRGGVLFVGPHEPYLAYVSDVLPSLGEEGVQTCTLRHLVPEGATAHDEPDAQVAQLKSQRAMVESIERAVLFYEEPPVTSLAVSTSWADVRITEADWAEAFEACDPGTAHNDARDQIWEALVGILSDKHDDEDLTLDLLRKDAAQNEELVAVFNRAWPILQPTDVVADLWSVPAYLTLCAPWLSKDEVRALQRTDPYAWTDCDLPLLDAARQRLGDPDASTRQRRRRQTLSSEQQYMAQVVDDLIEADDDGEGLVTQLKVQDMKERLVNEDVLPTLNRDSLAGPFAHIIVDEAQELTDAQWQMLLSRCPSRSMTVVGDRAQARHGFTESWQSRLARVGLGDVSLSSLSINYRTPSEVMQAAEPIILAAIPDANVPTSIRTSGIPVRYGSSSDLAGVLDDWRASNPDGIGCVIGDPSFEATDRVRALSPVEAKGLEFDLVVLADPEGFGTGIEGAVDRYVAMTRTTQQLVVLTTPGSPLGSLTQ